MRLPLQPVGLHSDKSDDENDVPADFSPDPIPPNASQTSHSLDESEAPRPSVTADPANDEMTVIEVEPSANGPKESKIELKNFWAYMRAKMAAAKQWAKEVLASLKGNHKTADKQRKSFDQGNARI